MGPRSCVVDDEAAGDAIVAGSVSVTCRFFLSALKKCGCADGTAVVAVPPDEGGSEAEAEVGDGGVPDIRSITLT